MSLMSSEEEVNMISHGIRLFSRFSREDKELCENAVSTFVACIYYIAKNHSLTFSLFPVNYI